MAGYLNGALVVETVFSWPGIGWLALNRAVYDNDFPLLQGTVFTFIIVLPVLRAVGGHTLRGNRPAHPLLLDRWELAYDGTNHHITSSCHQTTCRGMGFRTPMARYPGCCYCHCLC